MTDKMLKIEYRCEHPSCQVFCKKGEIYVGEAEYEELKAVYDEEGVFRSPRDICRMGFSQPFMALKILEDAAKEGVSKKLTPEEIAADPIEILKHEHIEFLRKGKVIEVCLRKRDVAGLWESTAALEDFIILHSIKKEEHALFPMITGKVPMGEAYMNIVHEDHKEFLSLIHSFRCALQNEDILDGLIKSVLVNIGNHIRKENEEFFVMIEGEISDDDKKKLVAIMKKIDDEHVTIEAGDINVEIDSSHLQNRKEMDFEIRSNKNMGTVDDWSCH